MSKPTYSHMFISDITYFFLTQWQTPIYCIKYKPETLNRYYRFQENYISDSQNVLLVL